MKNNDKLRMQKLRGDAIVTAMKSIDDQIGGSTMRVQKSGTGLSRNQVLEVLGLTDDHLKYIKSLRSPESQTDIAVNRDHDVPVPPDIFSAAVLTPNKASPEVVERQAMQKRHAEAKRTFTANREEADRLWQVLVDAGEIIPAPDIFSPEVLCDDYTGD